MTTPFRLDPAARGVFPSLTEREAKVLEVIGAMRAAGEPPTYERLADLVGKRSRFGVYPHVQSLAEKGLLTRRRSARSIRLTALGEAFLPPALSAWDWDERRAS